VAQPSSKQSRRRSSGRNIPVPAALKSEEEPYFKVLIQWLNERAAFTAPGEYIYFSGRLLELCPKDEHIAFVLGHELAHHQLGHVALSEG
jgi:Zn-dependent protease with chaperone function